jgi:hypothetical protein
VAHLRAWERAWCRTYRLARHRRPQVARAPALAELAWTRPDTEQVAYGRFLLLPDPGGLSIPTFRAQLGRLVDLQWATGERLPVLVVATTSVDRVRAWTTLVERVSRMRGWTPLLANVTKRVFDDSRVFQAAGARRAISRHCWKRLRMVWR